METKQKQSKASKQASSICKRREEERGERDGLEIRWQKGRQADEMLTCTHRLPCPPF